MHPSLRRARRWRVAALLLAWTAGPSAVLSAQEGGLVVEVQGQRTALPAPILATLPRDTARVRFRDTTSHLYEGIPLHALLARAGVHADSMRGRRQVGRRVVLEAADGYRVVLSLAEVDPALADRTLLLADRVDGTALPAEEGPWRLVIGGDPRHSRWIRNVGVVRVLEEFHPDDAVRQVTAVVESMPRVLAEAGPLGWLEFMDPGVGFEMVSDGVLLFPTLDSTAAFLRVFGPTIAVMDLRWDSVRVDVPAPSLAVFGTAYRESITDTAGVTTTFGGYVTGLFRHDGTAWRLRSLHWSSPAGAATTSTVAPEGSGMEHVTGIGGFFFRARDPKALAAWYEDRFGISRVPETYEEGSWWQETGPTVFAPFAATTKYFGRPEQDWMINLRVRDLDAMVAQLRAAGIEVEVDPEQYPNGRFARLEDPEGNPIQLWQPEGEAVTRMAGPATRLR